MRNSRVNLKFFSQFKSSSLIHLFIFEIEGVSVWTCGQVVSYTSVCMCWNEAKELDRYFRNNMYPGEGTGLLHLHSTYRHDLKIYSSDEGHVQVFFVISCSFIFC
ncbi:hypothetical protein RND81_08G101800 [Saponaria officinalis]|uniref:Uncharacterized protein n=1 Tax=Saponaria officinalis TaxID=3572 RepID=A0AAW1J735_SAPOF